MTRTRTPSDLLAQIAALRDRLGALHVERAAVLAAPVPPDVAADRLRAAIAAAAGEFSLDVRGFMDGDGGHRIDLAGALRRSPTSVLAALAGDTLEAGGLALLRAAYANAPAALDAKARHRRLMELHAELLATERDEEIAIRAAEDAGLDVQRRDDARPEIVLAEFDEAA